MKKLYLIVAIAIFASLSINSYAQSNILDSVTAYAYCTGQSLSVNYTSSTGQLNPNLSVKVYMGDGNVSTHNITTSSYIFGVHNYATSGSYTLKFLLLQNGIPIDSTTKSISSYCRKIHIGTYLDLNSNCTKDQYDSYISGPKRLEVSQNNTIIDTIVFVYSYAYDVVPGNNYSFKILNNNAASNVSLCPNNQVMNVNVPASFTSTNIDFGYKYTTPTNFNLYTTNTGRFRPVNYSYIDIYARNMFVNDSVNAVLTLQIDPKYEYYSANIKPKTKSGNTIVWTPAELGEISNAWKYFRVFVKPKAGSNVQIGDTVCNTITIDPLPGDTDPSNNTATVCKQVVSSYDPNEKSVTPEGNITSGTRLTYRIDFENLGNDTAFDVRILDTLSQHLDPSTIEIVESSHYVTASLHGGAPNTILQFEFPNILLADSSDKQYNKGFITFSIKVKGNRAPNIKILNRAGIYFDINPVVLTNYAENTIALVSVSEVLVEKDVNIYPNPTTGMLTVQTTNKQYSSVQVFNTIGQLMLEQAVTAHTTQINIQHLVSGIYYIQLKGEHGTVVEKIEKQ